MIAKSVALSIMTVTLVCNGGDSGDDFDACAIVTQQDATDLFGQPAEPWSSDTPIIDPNFVGDCLWTWEAPNNDSHLLQFLVWNGEQYYSAPSDSMPHDIGDEGYIRVHDIAGVDISWIQGGQTIAIAYSTVGDSVPSATTKVDEVKALAAKVAAAL